jgi:hypothetical protein
MNYMHTQVRLRNAMDEARARRGMLESDKVRTCNVDAVVDTESVWCVIPSDIAERLGLTIRGQRTMEQADDFRDMVPVTGAIYVEILGRDTVEEALVYGTEVRIGYTVLAKLDLVADCPNRRLVPNPAHPDGPVTKVK